jgi:23S rRNA pseudouridine1911/1915/1917 synthase
MPVAVATEADVGLRLDAWLARRIPGLSRSRVQALIEAGHVTADGRTVQRDRRVTVGLEVRVTQPEPRPSTLAPEAIPLEIVYEDDSVLVLAKPAGLVVHPAAGHDSGTLVNALLHHCRDLPGIGGERRPGIVHRLDRDTSGAMVVAKTESAMAHLAAQFRRRTVKKEYLALVHGTPVPPEGVVDTLIGRSRHDRKRMSTRPAGAGRQAVSRYRVLASTAGYSLVRVRIETGRTHQIRVHMAAIGHPVAGDRQYGGRRAAREGDRFLRQMLHAERLSFTHPVTGRILAFAAPLPADFRAALESLGFPRTEGTDSARPTPDGGEHTRSCAGKMKDDRWIANGGFAANTAARESRNA